MVSCTVIICVFSRAGEVGDDDWIDQCSQVKVNFPPAASMTLE